MTDEKKALIVAEIAQINRKIISLEIHKARLMKSIYPKKKVEQVQPTDEDKAAQRQADLDLREKEIQERLAQVEAADKARYESSNQFTSQPKS